MKLLPIKRFEQFDIQPKDYLNAEFQAGYALGNTSIDSKNILANTLRHTNFADQAWMFIKHYKLTSLTSIAVTSVINDYDGFGFKQTITVPDGIMTGSLTLNYQINSIFEKNWILTNTYLVEGYNDDKNKYIIHHKFGVFLDGILISETDNLSGATYNTVHLPFYSPVTAGEHILELRVKLPQGDINAETNIFVPDTNYGYLLCQVRRR